MKIGEAGEALGGRGGQEEGKGRERGRSGAGAGVGVLRGRMICASQQVGSII